MAGSIAFITICNGLGTYFFNALLRILLSHIDITRGYGIFIENMIKTAQGIAEQ